MCRVAGARIAVVLLWAMILSGPAVAQGPSRIVSLNLCADQILLTLLDDRRIAALSPNASDPAMSYHAERAQSLPATSGSAEEVLLLEPDLVLAGPFAGAEAKTFLRSAGLKLVELAIPETLAGVADQLRDMGRMLGVSARAETMARRFEEAVASARTDAREPLPRALYLQRRGFAPGRGTLVNELFQAAGLSNAVAEAGFQRYDLEQLLTLDVDLIVMDGEPELGDQGSAILVHPALLARFADTPRILLPLEGLVCPGPWTAEAVERLSRAGRQAGGE